MWIVLKQETKGVSIIAKGQTYDEDFKKTIAPLYLGKKTAS